MEDKKTLGAFLSIFNKLSLQQRLFIGGVFVIMIVLVGFIFLAVNEPAYVTLYSNMNADDAAKVIEHLNSEKVPYNIEAGQTISIPSDKIHEVRLSLAAQGIPSSGIIGYEIFDKNTMGMSEFMQKLNFKRALEGELSKTIMQIRGVEKARVNIVIPEKSIFKDEEKDPTASVALKLGGYTLSQDNIAAITNLVSASVEGLMTEKVTIIDHRGRLLTRKFEEDGLSLSSGKQYEITGKVENYLANKAQSILDKVVGYGNSDVKVNAQLDFTQIEKTMTTYDPDSQVAVSEQSSTTTNSGVSRVDSNLVEQQNSVTNYELSKSIETVISGTGNIRRVTVAAVVNGVKQQVEQTDGTVVNEFQPRTQEQINQLEQLIRQAVGIDANRNDQISVVSIPFENQIFEEPIIEEKPIGDINEITNLVVMVAGFLAAMFILKQLMGKLKNQKILIGNVSGGGVVDESAFSDVLSPENIGSSQALSNGSSKMQQQLAKKRREMLNVGDIEDEISDEAVSKKMEQEKIINYVGKNPQESAKLINSWLREDEY